MNWPYFAFAAVGGLSYQLIYNGTNDSFTNFLVVLIQLVTAVIIGWIGHPDDVAAGIALLCAGFANVASRWLVERAKEQANQKNIKNHSTNLQKKWVKLHG